uniref:Uncharacterized protein n=1 Tax=Arundo donax TaxID=35708 RepID=A0A0A9C7P5_ARUDO
MSSQTRKKVQLNSISMNRAPWITNQCGKQIAIVH